MENNSFIFAGVAIGAWQRCGRSAVTTLLLLVFIFLLGSCGSPTITAHTTPHTIAATPNNRISITPTQTQQYEFTAEDSGKTVTYVVTSRFGIELNRQKYPKQNIQVSCTPPDTIGGVSNLPSVMPPLYAVRYQAVQPGKCTIRNGSFHLEVKVIPLSD